MTLRSVPRRRPQPDLRDSADPSARLSDTREAATGGRVERLVARGLGRLEAGRGCISQPPPRLSDPVLRSEASGNISVLSTVDSSRAQVPRGHGPPREKEPPIHAQANPAPRERPDQSPSSLNLAGEGPWRSRASKGSNVPCPLKFSLCTGRGLCPSLLGDALPGARLVGRAGGERD